MRLGLAFALVFSATSCASEPRIVPIVGPDGTPMFHVSCSGSEVKCYELAGQRCPQGYELGRTPAGNLLVRCRVAVAGSNWAPALELAPTPYASATGSANYATPVPMTTVPPGYPPLVPGRRDDVGY